MWGPMFHLILVMSAQLYNNNRDKNGSSYVRGTDTNCTCTTIATNICMRFICDFSITRPSCFPGSSQLASEDGSFKALSDIKIGDRVLVNEYSTYEPILAFIHAEPSGLFGFLAVDVKSTASNASSTISISSDHLMFDFDSGHARFARSFRAGDRIQLVENAQIVPGTIISIRQIKQRGYYAPLTPSGTIVINGVLCSNYAIVENHALAHKAMGIYRWWIDLVGPSTPSDQIPWMLQIMYSLEKLVRLGGGDIPFNSYI